MPSDHSDSPTSLPAVDLCQAQAALSAVLGVALLLAVGVALDSSTTDLAMWWASFALACGLAMPAVLSWLVVGCLAFRRLADGSGSRALAAGLIGAAASLWPWLGWHGLQGAHVDPLRGTAIAAAGALTALVFTLGLRYRRLLTQPAQASTRLAVLQSRIRPHFLFNTLNTAIALVRIDPWRAESVLEDLSDLFRAVLAEAESDPAVESTLAEELALGRRYLAIEQVRFGERLGVHWDLDPAAEGARLPPLLLQPLLENAVRHGVEPSSDKASVHILTRREAGLVRLVITNSIPPEASVPGHRMALDNLRERLSLMHGMACDFRAGRDGDRFRVAIQLPA